MRERVGKRGKQHARFRVRSSQVHRAVQRDNGFTCPSGPGDAYRAIIVLLHQLALFRVQEDRPLIPRKGKSTLQLRNARHDAEAALRVWVLERRSGLRRLRYLWLAASGELQQRLCGLRREVVRERKQRVLVGPANVL